MAVCPPNHQMHAEGSLIREHNGADQRPHNCRIRFHNERRGCRRELAPRNLLVGRRCRVASIACRAVRNLTEIAPQRAVKALKILPDQRHGADGEVASNTTANLEETNLVMLLRCQVPVNQTLHLIKTGFNRIGWNVARNLIGDDDIAAGGVFPAC
eukprot:COSAG05_NODE_947_length_6480_cov_15.036671_3_plen_156_part_00